LYCIRASNRRETPALARVRESGRPSPVRARSCGSSSSTITTTTTWAMAMADDGPSALFQTCASFSWPWQPSFFRIARFQHAHVEPHPVELHKRPARRRPNPLALRCELRGMQCRAVATSVQRPASSVQRPAQRSQPGSHASPPALERLYVMDMYTGYAATARHACLSAATRLANSPKRRSLSTPLHISPWSRRRAE
jgi:hypothetical protein